MKILKIIHISLYAKSLRAVNRGFGGILLQPDTTEGVMLINEAVRKFERGLTGQGASRTTIATSMRHLKLLVEHFPGRDIESSTSCDLNDFLFAVRLTEDGTARIRTKRTTYRVFMEHVGEKMPIADISRDKIEAFKQSRFKDCRRGTVRSNMVCLSPLFEYAVKSGAIQSNPVKEVDSLKYPAACWPEEDRGVQPQGERRRSRKSPTARVARSPGPLFPTQHRNTSTS
jgi:hypothetical protein